MKRNFKIAIGLCGLLLFLILIAVIIFMIGLLKAMGGWSYGIGPR